MAQLTGTVRRPALSLPRATSQAFYLLRRWPILPMIVLVTLAVFAIFAPQIAPYDPTENNLRAHLAPPSLFDSEWYAENPNIEVRYIFGGDHVGRDVFSRIIHGARISMMVAGISLVTGMTIGTALGLIAGYFGGMTDEIIMRIMDLWYALPFLLIALVVAVVFQPSMPMVMGLLALLAWSAGVRNVRAEVLSLKERDYVALSRVAGASTIRIMWRHLVPNVLSTVLVVATLRVGGLILAEASLSFLGAGIPAPTPAWGLMVAEGHEHLRTSWWIAFFPGMAIFLTVMSFNFIGDWIRDRMDPRLRQL